MAFRVPQFNLTCNVWRLGNPVTNAPDLVTPAQLRASGKQSSGQVGGGVLYYVPEVLFPAHTDVRDSQCPGSEDTIEIPAGTGRYYVVNNVEDVAKGFANEYRQAVVVKSRPWPIPIP
jgi:hypothetical protein